MYYIHKYILFVFLSRKEMWSEDDARITEDEENFHSHAEQPHHKHHHHHHHHRHHHPSTHERYSPPHERYSQPHERYSQSNERYSQPQERYSRPQTPPPSYEEYPGHVEMQERSRHVTFETNSTKKPSSKKKSSRSKKDKLKHQPAKASNENDNDDGKKGAGSGYAGELPYVQEHVYVAKSGQLKYKKSTSLCWDCCNLVLFALGVICVGLAALMFAVAEYNTNLITAFSASSSMTASSNLSGTISCSQQIPLPVVITSNTYPYTNTFTTTSSVGNITHAEWWQWLLIGFFGFYLVGFLCFIGVHLISLKMNARSKSNVRIQDKDHVSDKDLYPCLRNCPKPCRCCFKMTSKTYQLIMSILRRSLVYLILVTCVWFAAIMLFYFLYGMNSTISYGPANTRAQTINSGLFVTFPALPAGCTAPLSLNVIQTETIQDLSGTVSLSGDSNAAIPWWANLIIAVCVVLISLSILYGWYKAICCKCVPGCNKKKN